MLKVPAVFVLQSNGYAYSTPTSRQMVNTCMADRDRGRLGHSRDARRRQRRDRDAGRRARRDRARRARGGGPRAVEAVTLRLDGHAAHDDGSYMDQAQLSDYVAQRDPIERLAARLRLDGLSDDEIEALRAVGRATRSPPACSAAEASPAPDPATILDGVYATKLT